MIAKKNSRFDLERKRIVLFNIGLLTAGAFTLAAFTYSEPIARQKDKLEVAATEIDVQVEYQQPKQEEQQRQTNPQQNETQEQQSNIGSESAVTDDMTATSNGNSTPDAGVGSDGPPGFSFPVTNPGRIDVGEVIEIPIIEAEYIGGFIKMSEHIMDVMEYPQIDVEMGNQGRVYVSFVVEKDGSVSNIKIERGVSETLDREAKRIVRSFPKWKPGEDAYGKARTRVLLPINFVLEG